MLLDHHEYVFTAEIAAFCLLAPTHRMSHDLSMFLGLQYHALKIYETSVQTGELLRWSEMKIRLRLRRPTPGSRSQIHVFACFQEAAFEHVWRQSNPMNCRYSGQAGKTRVQNGQNGHSVVPGSDPLQEWLVRVGDSLSLRLWTGCFCAPAA